MTSSTFTYSFCTVGLARKQIAEIISEAIKEPLTYEGVPTFAYRIGNWKIDRNGEITTPELRQYDELQQVFDKLTENGVSATGKATLTTSFSGHNGITFKNIVNTVYSKSRLLKNSLDLDNHCIIPDSFVESINSVYIETISEFEELAEESETGDVVFDFHTGTIKFGFFNATLDFKAVKTYVILCQKINIAAISQRRSTARQSEPENEKYAMRCWLLKLGFIGAEYATMRKLLLQNLSGNAAFKTDEQLKASRERHRQSAV